MARLYADENFPRQVSEELRKLGHDVLTVAEAGHAEQAVPDEEVLAFATIQARAVLTINRRHFIRLHGAQPEHMGIIVCTLDLDFIGQAYRIHTLLEANRDMTGRLLRVNRPVA